MTASRGLRPAMAREVTMLPSEEPGWQTQAERRALRQFLADLPDPHEVALALPGWAIETLVHATRSENGLRLTDPDRIRDLRRFGLVEYGGPHLTNFGAAVRRAIMEG